jgi:hypothetical protein
MSATQVSKGNLFLSFLGGLGAILIFVLILSIAYLPNRPDPVNAQANIDRQLKADDARAAGLQKLTGYEVINAQEGIARIPIQDAMQLTVSAYNSESAQ